MTHYLVVAGASVVLGALAGVGIVYLSLIFARDNNAAY